MTSNTLVISEIVDGPSQVSLDVTYRCNFKCLHCYNSSGENCFMNNELTDEELVSLVEDIAKIKPYNICFCGGEPLLRKNVLKKCAIILKNAGIPNIAVVTNGSLVSEKVASELYNSGFNKFQVSIDGVNSKTHEKLRIYKNSFNLAVNAIKIFRKFTNEIDVAFCPTNFSIEQFKEVYELVNNLGVKSLRVQPFMISGRGLNNMNIAPSYKQYKQLVADINYLKSHMKYTTIDWGDPIDHIIRNRTILKEYCNFVSINANGGLMASPYLPIEIGNVRNHSIIDYWKSGLYKPFSLKIVQQISNQVSSINDMGKKLDGKYIKWLDDDIKIDIIDTQEKIWI